MDSLLTSVSIDPQEHAELLSSLQGNILKSHGRAHVRLLLVRFTAPADQAATWVRALGRGWVTVANARGQQGGGWDSGPQESVFTNLFLTCAGYRRLGVEEARIPADPAFRRGMLGSGPSLCDPPGAQWEPPYAAEDPFHAMVLMACASESLLAQRAAYVERSLVTIATVRTQTGRAIRRGGAPGPYVDHLNFADGISQPLFLRKDVEEASANGGTSRYDPSAPLGLALVQEPPQPGGTSGGYGSYLVYRKLEQNVRGFRQRVRQLGEAPWPSAADPDARLDPADRSRVGAMVMGRDEEGRPLALPPGAAASNDFDYADDPDGRRCPLFAHVRKMNPRTPASRAARIVRRGVTYDDVGRARPPFAEQAEAQMPEAGVGLLFMCFQASIEDQFEALQRAANDPDRPLAGTGIDPLAGQSDDATVAAHRWPRQWGGAETCSHAFGRYTRLKEGEYFFAPSRAFLATL